MTPAEVKITKTRSNQNSRGRTTSSYARVAWPAGGVQEYEITTFCRADSDVSAGTEIYSIVGDDPPRFVGYYRDVKSIMAPYMHHIVNEHGRRVLQAIRDHEAGAKRCEWREVVV